MSLMANEVFLNKKFLCSFTIYKFVLEIKDKGHRPFYFCEYVLPYGDLKEFDKNLLVYDEAEKRFISMNDVNSALSMSDQMNIDCHVKSVQRIGLLLKNFDAFIWDTYQKTDYESVPNLKNILFERRKQNGATEFIEATKSIKDIVMAVERERIRLNDPEKYQSILNKEKVEAEHRLEFFEAMKKLDNENKENKFDNWDHNSTSKFIPTNPHAIIPIDDDGFEIKMDPILLQDFKRKFGI